MGLLLSVLVVCVGVLEVLACVRHFQDGYLPLWTPHCAVTSGYTASYERWRKRPSDSCEFRSFDDVNGALYATEKVLPENCLTGFSNIQNGFNGKQADKAGENMCPSTDLYCQQSKTCSEDGLSPSIDDRSKDVNCHNIADDLASTVEPSEDELKLINKSIASATPSYSIPDIPEHSGKTNEVLTAGIFCDLPNEKNPVNVSTEYRVMISHTQAESAVPPGDPELERTFSRDEGIEKYSISDKEIDIEHEVPVLNACDESYASTFGVNNGGISEGDSSDGCVGGKTTTQNGNAVRLEENLEILSPNLCGENILDTALRDTVLSAVETEDRRVPVAETEGISEGDLSDGCLGGKTTTQNDNAVRLEENLEILSPNLCGENILDSALRDMLLSAIETEHGHVPVTETERNISMSDSMAEGNSVVAPGRDQVPSRQTEVQVPSPDSVVDKFTSSVTKPEEQIQPTSPEVNIPSCLQTQEDKSIIGLVERDQSITGGEIFGEPDSSDSNSLNEAVNATCLNNADSFQNSVIPHLLSEETSITPMKVSSEYNVRMSVDGFESRHTDVCEQPDNSPESFGVRKELSDLNIQTESERCLSTECAEQCLGTGVRKGKEALNSNFDNSYSGYDTESGTGIQQCPVVSQDANMRNITFEESTNDERSLSPEEVGTEIKHAVVDPSIARDPCSPDVQNETDTGVTNEDAEKHVSESCLDSQTILSDSVISRDDGTLHDIDLPAFGDLTKDSVNVESSNLQASSDISVTPFAVNPAVQLSASVLSLTINTALETPVSITPVPNDIQPSLSPPKVPSTPKRSKADISWPTFFPGTPVIKRPSVSFATPESVSANDDDEFLRKYLEESSDLSSLQLSDDNSTATESESTASTNEERLWESVGISETSDLLEEPDPIIYREKSPSGIVSGNDFSRKELKLQRRRSYKQKRYNSAVEIRTRDEEAEDRSFSENNPVLSRASSVREPKKRYKQPAKSSSFEDALLHDLETEGPGEEYMTNTTEEISDVSVPEGRETEREETKHEQENFEETKKTNVIAGCPTVSTERNESKFDELKPEEEEKWIEGNGTEGQTEDNIGGDDEEYSLSEEQSSSQQKSPPKEAFWVSREDGTH